MVPMARRLWPLAVAALVAAAVGVAAVVATLGSSNAEDSAQEAEAELAAAVERNRSTVDELRQTRRSARMARQDERAVATLFKPGMAEILRAAYLRAAVEVCSSSSGEDLEGVLAEVAADVVSREEGLAGHDGWAAVVDPAELAGWCDGG
jgi:hypothetical protein